MDEQMGENYSPEEKPPQEEQLPEGEGPIPDDQEMQEPQPMGRYKRYGLFAAGFLGWFLVNGLLWLLISGGRDVSFEAEGIMVSNGICIFPLNLIIMILLFWKKVTRIIGQGILAAYGMNLVVSLILGLTYNAFCLVPFFS